MRRRFHWLPLALLLVGFATALYTLSRRYQVEARSRAVGLALDYAQVRTLIAATGVEPEQAYRALREAGATHLAITEETLGELESEGLLRVEVARTDGGRQYQVAFQDPLVAARTGAALLRLLGERTTVPTSGDHVVFPVAAGRSLYVGGRFDEIRALPIGLDPQAVREAQAVNFQIVGRLYNPLSLTAPALRAVLQEVKDLGVTTVIFAGEDVLGFRGLVKETAQAIRDLGLQYGSVEFGKQRGDDQLAKLLEDRLVRVHSISPAEMPRLTPNEAIERYVRAAVERNIRLEYVRLPGVVTERTFQDSVDYLSRFSHGMVRAGFGLGAPLPFTRVWPEGMAGRLGGALIALGIGAGTALLAAALVPFSGAAQAGLALAAAAGCALLALSGVSVGVQLVALLAAVVFPTLGFALYPQPTGAFTPPESRDAPRGWLLPSLLQFAGISLVTLVGALLIAAELSELPYLVKTSAFAGIKAATVLPLLAVGWIYLTGMSSEYASWDEERRAIAERLRGFFAEPVRVWHTVAMLAALVALGLLVARSGNDAGIGVSETELRFRALLDRLLGVRPRTKEFLVGHPALILGLALAVFPRLRPWAFPALLLGIIGQVGLLNSFCHLHTPLKVTLIRTFNGAWTGALLGVLATGVLFWLLNGARLSSPARVKSKV